MKLRYVIGFALLGLISLPYLAPGAGEVLLVKGTASVPAGAERNYAESLTRRLGRWLGECGIPHTVAKANVLAM